VRAVGFNDKTGRKLVTVNTDGVNRFLDLSGKSPRQISILQIRGFGDVSMALGSGGKRLAVSEVRDIEIYGLKAPLQGHQEVVTGLAYSPDGQSLASCGRDGRLIVWNLTSMKPRYTKDRPERFTCVAYPPPPAKGKPSAATTLAAGTDNGQL
jgi:WD40 repeat protein